MPILSVDNLTFEYPGTRALEDVSFTIEPGTATALVGPNGAGKTTLMNCLAALDRPLSGNIEIDGIPVLEEPRLCHERIGYLPDFFGLYDDLTVRQCLLYIAQAQGIPEQNVPDAVTSVAKGVQLEDRLEQKAGTLSRGLRQRLAIAQALIHDPPVLLLDEPASGLDPEARHHLAQLLTHLRNAGKTLIVSSHILSELSDYSTHMMVIRDGKLLEHQKIGDTPKSSTQTLVITLHEPFADIAPILRSVPGVKVVSSDTLCIEVECASDPKVHHDLIKHLISRNVPLSSLAPKTTNLQDDYISRFGGQPDAS